MISAFDISLFFLISSKKYVFFSNSLFKLWASNFKFYLYLLVVEIRMLASAESNYSKCNFSSNSRFASRFLSTSSFRTIFSMSISSFWLSKRLIFLFSFSICLSSYFKISLSALILSKSSATLMYLFCN